MFTLYDNNKIILKTCDNNLILLYLSDDFNIYKRKNLNFYQHTSFMERNFNLIKIYHIYNSTKFLKTSSNQYIFINEGRAYIENSSSTMAKENDLLNFFKVPNVKQNNDKFKSNHSQEKSDDFNSVKQYKYILKGNSVYYKDDNNNILEGIIIISILVIKCGYFTNISHRSKIIMFDENLKKRFEIGFQYPFNYYDRIGLLEIIYNYLNDIILIFIDSKIYQINRATEQVVAIYNNDEINSSCEVNSFYSYNEKNNNFEQIIIANKKDSGEIFIFQWKEKCIFLKKKYVLPKIKEIIPLFTPTILRDFVNNNENERTIDEKILLIESDKLLLYN